MRYRIETERVDLFDVSIVITMCLKLAGDVSFDMLKNAFDKACTYHEVLCSKIVIEPDGEAYYTDAEKGTASNTFSLSGLSLEELIYEKTVVFLADKLIKATSRATLEERYLDDPAPEVLVAAHSQSAIVLKLRIWCKAENYWSVYFDMWEDAKKAFDKFGIEIPYNHLDVTLVNPENE